MPLRIAILGHSPCPSCHANCCKQNGHDYAVLLQPHEYPRFAPFSTPIPINSNGHRITERVLPYIHGRCQFLDPDDRCAIYQDRPLSCRQFECIRDFNARGIARHGQFLELNVDVKRMLENL